MAMLDEIATYLAGAGLGLTANTNLLASYITPTPDALVVLFEYPGMVPDETMNNDLPVNDKPRLQVVSRHTSYSAAHLMAANVRKKLLLVRDRVLSPTYYYRIQALDVPFLLERDSGKRVVVACNFQVEYQPN